MTRFPPKKILVACDFSDASKTAWRHAEALARRCAASLEAVYVEPWQPGIELPPPDMSPPRLRPIRARMRGVVGQGTKLTVLRADPAKGIIAAARAHRADLIVVGTHDRGGLRRALLGSVAEAVVRGSPVPVLAARGPVRPIRSILAPVNFTAYAERGFAYAAGAAAALRADLTALHVNDDPVWSSGTQSALAALFNRLPASVRSRCRFKAESVTGAVPEGILRARLGHDWLVLVEHKAAAVKSALMGTTAERVLRNSTIPVLIVPFEGEPAARQGAAV